MGSFLHKILEDDLFAFAVNISVNTSLDEANAN